MKHQVVYSNPDSYCAFADIERLRDGTIAIAFREADRRRFATHTDRTARLVMIRSRDEGNTWQDKSLIYDEPEASLQDPSLRQLSDGTLIVSFFKWKFGVDFDAPTHGIAVRPLDESHATWLAGVYVTRSSDSGTTWSKPIRVDDPDVVGHDVVHATSDAVIELPSGDLIIPIETMRRGHTESASIMRSSDTGLTWNHFQTIAHDPLGLIGFYEPALIRLRSGKIICMMRTHLQTAATSESASYLYQSNSVDDGRTWSAPVRTNLWGHPAQLYQLSDGRIICSYGYRRIPFGIRSAISHNDGDSWDVSNEIVLRADGESDDLGYPTTVELKDGNLLTTYYMYRTPAGDRSGYAGIEATRYAVPE